MISIKDSYGTSYICLTNYENLNCYFITTIQILHSSPTFHKLVLNNKEYLLKTFPDLFSPVIIYEEGTNGNFQDTIEYTSKLSDSINESIHFNEPIIRSGYDYLALLLFYYLPVIYSLVNYDKERLINIIIELSMEPTQISNNTKIDLKFLADTTKILPIVNKYHQDLEEIINLYYQKLKSNDRLKLSYNCTGLESYINNDKYGHVFAVINNNGKLFVADNHQMESLYNYLLGRRHLICEKLRLNYYSSSLLELYNNNLKTEEINFKGFVHNQYSLVFREFDKYIKNNNFDVEPVYEIVDKVISHNEIINDNNNNDNNNFRSNDGIYGDNLQSNISNIPSFDSGKDTEPNTKFKAVVISETTDYKKKYYIFLSLFIVSVIVIIGLVIKLCSCKNSLKYLDKNIKSIYLLDKNKLLFSNR